MSVRHIIVVACLTIGGVVLVFALFLPGVFRDREWPSAEILAAGHAVYQQHCASCHGANLEGQPNWQTPLPSGRLPAPPHDASGHTWHHSDRLLFAITEFGTAAVVGGGHESDMPGFKGVLGDEEIRAVLSFIKSTWPERERRYQQEASRRDETSKRSQ